MMCGLYLTVINIWYRYKEAPTESGTIYAFGALEVVLIPPLLNMMFAGFLDDGVYQLKMAQQTKGIETKNFSPTYARWKATTWRSCMSRKSPWKHVD